MELNLDGEQSTPIGSMIQTIVFNDNLMQKLRATQVIISSLDDKTKRNTNAVVMKQYIEKIFRQKEFMRKLKYVSLLKSNIELSVEYHGQDYLSEPDYHYDETMENKMDEIEDKLVIFLGSVLKELQKGVEINV